MKMKLNIFLLCAAAFFFNSCLGVNAGIVIKADGSGKIELEYRVSQALESLGRLDGNERRPVVPVGRADFERSVARIPGLKLSKYVSKDVSNRSGGSDLVTNVTLDFKDTGALLAFLDSSGTGAALVQQGEGGPSLTGKLLQLNLIDPSRAVTDPDLLALLKEISTGYDFSISFTLPKNASIKTIPETVPEAKLVSGGKKVSFSIGMGQLLSLQEGLALEIRY